MDIKIIRGRPKRFNVKLSYNGEPYELQPDETLKMTVKKNIYDEEPLLIKTGQPFEFDPQDTADISPGTLVFDIVLIKSDNKPYTIYPPEISDKPYANLRIVRGVYD